MLCWFGNSVIILSAAQDGGVVSSLIMKSDNSVVLTKSHCSVTALYLYNSPVSSTVANIHPKGLA